MLCDCEDGVPERQSDEDEGEDVEAVDGVHGAENY